MALGNRAFPGPPACLGNPVGTGIQLGRDNRAGADTQVVARIRAGTPVRAGPAPGTRVPADIQAGPAAGIQVADRIPVGTRVPARAAVGTQVVVDIQAEPAADNQILAGPAAGVQAAAGIQAGAQVPARAAVGARSAARTPAGGGVRVRTATGTPVRLSPGCSLGNRLVALQGAEVVSRRPRAPYSHVGSPPAAIVDLRARPDPLGRVSPLQACSRVYESPRLIQVRLGKLRGAKSAARQRQHGAPVRFVAFCPDQETMIVALSGHVP